MSWFSTFIYSFIFGALFFVGGFLAVRLPALWRQYPEKRYQYAEPVSLRENHPATAAQSLQDDLKGSKVDGQRAVEGFCSGDGKEK